MHVMDLAASLDDAVSYGDVVDNPNTVDDDVDGNGCKHALGDHESCCCVSFSTPFTSAIVGADVMLTLEVRPAAVAGTDVVRLADEGDDTNRAHAPVREFRKRLVLDTGTSSFLRWSQRIRSFLASSRYFACPGCRTFSGQPTELATPLR